MRGTKFKGRVEKVFDSLPELDGLRDLGDFCIAWPELRELVAKDAIEASDLSEDAKEVVAWLSLLADKVCRQPPGP